MKRLRAVRPSVDRDDPSAVVDAVAEVVTNHLASANRIWRLQNPKALLYRAFYYDAKPFTDKLPLPTNKLKQRDFSKTKAAQFRLALFQLLRKTPNFAVRLGEVRRARKDWPLKSRIQRELLSGEREISSLTDDDFEPSFQQKGVDMRLGVDIASITLKRQASRIILVTGDADFVPAAKLARREGVRIILDPMWQNVSNDLQEHIDGVKNAFPDPKRQKIT